MNLQKAFCVEIGRGMTKQFCAIIYFRFDDSLLIVETCVMCTLTVDTEKRY